MARVKYSKKTSQPRFGLKKTVCVILPRVDVNEFLRERRRRSLSITQNVSSSAPTTSTSSATVQTTAVKIARRRFRVKKEPPCIFHSQVDINNDDSAVEEIPAVLGEPIQQGSICLHEITRSMCYMCSPRHHTPAAEDKSEIWNQISSSTTNEYRSWHTPTPFVSNISTSTRAASPQPVIRSAPVPLIPQNIPAASSHTATSILNATADVGVGTDNIATQTRDQSTQTVRYFSCKHCLALFTDVGHLIHHKSVHQKMFECAFCPGNFASKNDLKNHMKLHMLPKYYDCVYCPQAFTKKHDIREHLTLHAEQKQFHCQLCPASFKQKNNLRNHEQSHNVSKFIHVFKKVDDGETAKKSTSPVKSGASGSNSPLPTSKPSKSLASGSTSPGNILKSTKSVSSGPTPLGLGVLSKPADRSVIFSSQKRLADAVFTAKRNPVSSYLELSSIRDEPSTSSFTGPAVARSVVSNSSTNTTSASQGNGTEAVSNKGNFFQCRHCPNSFKLYRGLKNHNICHTRKSGKFVCTACDAKFMKKSSLVMHTRYSHPANI